VFDAALRFSGCMRDHGVDVADPEVGGEGGLAFVISQRNLDDPDFTAAEDACGHLLPPGSLAPNLSPEEEVRQYDQAVRYARCMRERGIDLPDPEPAGSVIGLAPGTDPGDPEFVAAHEVCGVHLRDVQPAP
jgi:hypothetical protein